MNDKPEAEKNGDSTPEPAPSSPAPAPEAQPQGENWFDRLKAVIGLGPQSSLREDLAAALSREEIDPESFLPEERSMLKNILSLRDVRVADVMVPRPDINAVEVGVALSELFRRFYECGHSRMPVYRGTLDDPIGMVHIKDLFGYAARAVIAAADADATGTTKPLAPDLSRPLADLNIVRTMLFVPPSMTVTALLAKMQATRTQMAVVIDEYGATDGLLSIEDLVETVVGDIEDEYDDEEGPMISAEADGVFLADARATVEEVSEAVGEAFLGKGDEDIDTVGGLVYSLVGRIPSQGELLAAPGGYEIEILEADPGRVKRVKISRPTDRKAVPPAAPARVPAEGSSASA